MRSGYQNSWYIFSARTCGWNIHANALCLFKVIMLVDGDIVFPEDSNSIL